MRTSPTQFQFGIVRCSTHTIPQLIEDMRTLLLDKELKPRTVLCVNSHIYNLACRSEMLCRWLNEARIVTADGMAIVWMARLFGVRIPERCNMTEAFRAYLMHTGLPASRAMLVGCSLEEADAAARNINSISSHLRVVQTVSGYLNLEEYERLFHNSQDIDFILLGMGTPKSEEVAALAARVSPRCVAWAIGGGTVRIFAGTMIEAPTVWRRLGIQWLHRLLSEPAALWKRYIIGNPVFLWRICWAALSDKRRQP